MSCSKEDQWQCNLSFSICSEMLENVYSRVKSISIGGHKIKRGCLIEDPLFMKILPDFRLANFSKVGRAAAPQPPVSYAYGEEIDSVTASNKKEIDHLQNFSQGNLFLKNDGYSIVDTCDVELRSSKTITKQTQNS